MMNSVLKSPITIAIIGLTTLVMVHGLSDGIRALGLDAWAYVIYAACMLAMYIAIVGAERDRVLPTFMISGVGSTPGATLLVMIQSFPLAADRSPDQRQWFLVGFLLVVLVPVVAAIFSMIAAKQRRFEHLLGDV